MWGGSTRNRGDRTAGRGAGDAPFPLTSDGGRRFDEVLLALADRRRRYVLYCLREEETASLIEVARRIAAWERDCSVDTVSDDARAEIEMELYHAHLPQLQESGVIDYDDRSETLVFRDPPELVERCLEYCAPRELPE